MVTPSKEVGLVVRVVLFCFVLGVFFFSLFFSAFVCMVRPRSSAVRTLSFTPHVF